MRIMGSLLVECRILCVCVRVREGKCVCVKGCIFALKADIHNQFLYIRLKMS